MWQNGLLASFQGFGASFEARSCYQNTVLYFHNIVLGLWDYAISIVVVIALQVLLVTLVLLVLLVLLL